MILHFEYLSGIHAIRLRVESRTSKAPEQKQLTQLYEISNGSFIGINTDAVPTENETFEPQTRGLVNIFGRSMVGENSASRDQVIEILFADKIKMEFDKAAMAVENRVLDSILTTMDNVMKPKVENTVRSITESSGRGPNSIVQNPDKKDFSGNTENIALISASS